jgi:hypothetical protein
VRSSVNKSSSSSANPNTSLSSPNVIPVYVSTTEHATETMMIPRRRNYRRRNKVVRRNSSLKSKNNINTIKRTNHQQTRRIQLETCICSWKGSPASFIIFIFIIYFSSFSAHQNCTYTHSLNKKCYFAPLASYFNDLRRSICKKNILPHL